ncbi:MAG: hypothetical protein IJY85_02315 [Ruminococcus sp.]|nr:hypothetical protein [Ruminococcus sp.]
MNEEQNIGGLPQLEETTYTPKPREDRLANVQAAVLADDDYVDVRKKSSLEGVAAPTLAEDDYVDVRKKSSLDGIAAPTLADDTYVDPRKQQAEAPAPVQAAAPFVPTPLSDQQLEALQQRRIAAGQPPYTSEQLTAIQNAYLQKQIDAHAAQTAAAAPAPAPVQEAPAPVQAPVLEEPDYTPPPKKEPSVPQPSVAQAAALLEEPQEPERRVSRFNEADIEAAKANAHKRAVESTLNQPVNTDKEAARRMMNELRMEREAEMAKKGFKIVLVMMVLGIIAAVSLYLFSLQDFKPDMQNKFFQTLTDVTIYISAALGLASVLMIFRVEGLKSLASGLFALNGVGMGIVGFMELSQKASMPLSVAFWIVSVALSLVITFVLSTSEPINMYYKRRETDSY